MYNHRILLHRYQLLNEPMKTTCPICDAEVTLQKNTEESEIINCPECHSRLVVAAMKGSFATLEQAPAVEEDWGE